MTTKNRKVNQSPKGRMIELLLGAVISRAIYAAAELGIADYIQDKPQDAHTLAQQIGAHAQSLYRIMRMLAGHNIFEEDEQGRFSLTSLGECLLSTGTDSLRAFIRQEDEARWRAIGGLKSSILKGEPAFDQIYQKSYFEYLAADPKMNYRFEAGMSNLSEEENALIAEVLDVSQAINLVDVGGGRGGFLAEILKKNAQLKGTLFDLPHVVFPKDELLLNSVSERCEIVSGSFFESVPKNADIYILKRVLHDWDDRSCQKILNKCRESMHPQGKILAIEAIVPSGNDSHMIKDIDVYMMALFPGRERTESEFHTLFEAAGLKITNIQFTESDLSIIEGRKKTMNDER